MAGKRRTPDAGAMKQEPLRQAKERRDEERALGRQPNDFAEKANMKRQKKQMHEQTGK